MIAETIEQIIKEAHLKPQEEKLIVHLFGLCGETSKKRQEIIELFKQDESIKAQITHDWVLRHNANGLHKMRSAMLRLKINVTAFRKACKEEPYLSLCNVLIGYDELQEGHNVSK